MALKAVVSKAKYDALDPLIRAEYEEKDGKYVLSVDPTEGLALENAANLKSALQKERDNFEAATKKLEAFGDIDPKKAKDALSKVDEMKNWDKDEKTKQAIEAGIKSHKEKFDTDYKTVNDELGETRGQLETVLIDNVLSDSLGRAKGNRKLLLPHLRPQVKLEKEGKRYVARVVDANGQKRMTAKTGSMDPMTIDELVESLREVEEFQVAFEGSGSSGGGAGHGEGGKGKGGTRGKTIRVSDSSPLGDGDLEAIAEGETRVILQN